MKSGRIYAIHSGDGIVKFGCTSNLESRLQSLKNDRKIRATWFFASPKMEDLYHLAEKVLLSRARKMFHLADGSEYFFCRHRGDAKNLVAQTYSIVSGQKVSDGWFEGPKELSGWTRVRRLKKQQEKKSMSNAVQVDECGFINLALARVEMFGEEVKITSTLTGTVATMNCKQLQNWAIAQLRKELITPKAEAISGRSAS